MIIANGFLIGESDGSVLDTNDVVLYITDMSFSQKSDFNAPVYGVYMCIYNTTEEFANVSIEVIRSNGMAAMVPARYQLDSDYWQLCCFQGDLGASIAAGEYIVIIKDAASSEVIATEYFNVMD